MENDRQNELLSDDPWMAELSRLMDVVGIYASPISHKQLFTDLPLSDSECRFYNLHLYWQAVLINASDVFGNISFILEIKDDLVALGATGTLKAVQELMPWYEEQQRLEENLRGPYSRDTREARKSVEDQAEDCVAFGRLLLAFAVKNLSPPAS